MSVQSGNSNTSQSFRYIIEDSTQTGSARRHAAALANDLGFSESEKGRVAIIINELCTNLINHAKGGEIILRALPDCGPFPAIEILAIDKGCGISDIARAMQDGYSTTSTPGNGLGAVRRQSSEFDIYSQTEKGTVVVSIVHAGNAPSSSELQWKWSAINIPIKGETVCGDGWIFSTDSEKTVLAVADGLGHGILAHQASAQALEVFQSQVKSNSLDQLMTLIHGSLKSTRGAALSMASIEFATNMVRFTGVGNVRGLCAKGDLLKTLITYPGTLGLNLPRAKVISQPLDQNTVFAMHSDGITSRWDFSSYPGLLTRHPSLICAVIYRDFNRHSDDVTIVVGGYQ